MNKQKIAYSGIRGAYAETAAQLCFPDCEGVPCAGFAAAYEAVDGGKCSAAVLPLENSFAGDVAEVLDLAYAGKLYVTAVADVKISHSLLGTCGAKLSDIKSVISHEQALWQCAGFLHSRGWVQTAVSNTAVAAEIARNKGDISLGVIAGRRAADIYGLDVLAENINDSAANTTRFAVFARQPNTRGRHFIMFFTVKNQPGTLVRALSVISEHGINLRALKSRPAKTNNWEYYFYVEGEGDIECLEDNLSEALKKVCTGVKIVGRFDSIQQLDEIRR